ncbi:MAG: hypothetical protein ACR2M1_10425 [Gemmatimonadaceae bacterium]
MTRIDEILEACRIEKVDLQVDGERLLGSGRTPSPVLDAAIRANKRALIAAITLRTRLEAGEMKIARIEKDGEDVTALEDFWVDLLHEYERAEDREVRYLHDYARGHGNGESHESGWSDCADDRA